MPIKITYFVHGTTIDNEKGLATGWADGELSQKGIAETKELGQIIAAKNFDAVFCSDLKRAVDSAKLAFGDNYQIIQDKRLREINYGDFTGQSDAFKNTPTDYVSSPFPNGESYLDVEKRMADFCNFLKNSYHDKLIAVVSHQAPQLALEVILNHKTWPEAIQSDWRHTKSWQPGWEYEIK